MRAGREDEPYSVLTLRRGQPGVTWNGHTWPREYCRTVVEVRSAKRFARQQVRLSCGHWANIMARFCPSCGRAVVVELD